MNLWFVLSDEFFYKCIVFYREFALFRAVLALSVSEASASVNWDYGLVYFRLFEVGGDKLCTASGKRPHSDRRRYGLYCLPVIFRCSCLLKHGYEICLFLNN